MQSIIISNINELEDFKSFVLEANNQINIVAFDLETNGIVERTAKVYGVGLAFDCDVDVGYYIPIKDKFGGDFFGEYTPAVVAFINTILNSKKVIGHNIIYDALVWYHNYDIDISNNIYADTILMKHLIDEERPFGLKEVAVKYLGPWADKAQQDLLINIKANGGSVTKTNMEMYKADTEVLGTYCCYDVILTLKLFNLFSIKLKEENLENLFYKDEVMPLYKYVTIPMKKYGIKIDVDYFKNLGKEIDIDIEALEETIISELENTIGEVFIEYVMNTLNDKAPIKKIGSFPKFLAIELSEILPTSLAKKALANYKELKTVQWLFDELDIDKTILVQAQLRMFFDKHEQSHVFNLNSKEQLKHLFFNILGETPLSKTEKGEPQVDDDFMDSVSKKYKFVPMLQDLNKLNKIKGTYIDGLLDKHVDGIIYTSMLQFGTTSGRYSSTAPNCLSLDTEILTTTGFKKYNEIDKNTKLATYDGHEIVWEKYNNYYLSDNSAKDIVSVKNIHFDMRMSANHRVVYTGRKTNKLKECIADKFTLDGRILHGAYSEGISIGLDAHWLQFVIAVQADAEIRKDSSKIRFVFTKERKYKRLLGILHKLPYTYEDKSKGNRYEILVSGAKPEILKAIGYDKTFNTEWITMSSVERSIFLNEIFEWDGLSTRKNNYSSNTESNVDFIQALCVLEGWRAHKRIYRSIRSKFDNYQLDITRKNYSGVANALVTKENSSEQVWCVSVSTGMIVVRRGSDTFITGNCQNLPRPKEDDSGLSELVLKYTNAIRAGFVSFDGYKFLDTDYSALEPRIFAHVSGSRDLQNIFHEGTDMYSAIAIKMFNLKNVSAIKKDINFLGKLFPEKRQQVKAFCLAVVYGGESYRIGELLSIPREEAQRLIDMYLDAFPDLREYIKRCHYEVNHKGYVSTSFNRIRHLSRGREIYKMYGNDILDSRWARKNGLADTRREYKNLLNNSTNFKIQGMAAHVINRAMINIAKKFKDNNIDGIVTLMIHDQVVCSVNENQIEEARVIVRDAMQNVVQLDVPLIAEPAVATNLRDGH